MAIYDILNSIEDLRTDGKGICKFNGFLEDFLARIEDDEKKQEVYEVLKPLFEKDENLKIIENLHLNINKEAIANQIIRYKDAFKLPKGTIYVPYIVYGKFQDAQKAMILTMGDREEYIIAKALYYVISEPENEYEGTRNEIIALSVNKENIQRMLESSEDFFVNHTKAGIIQRRLDMKIFSSYEEMYKLAYDMGMYQQEHLDELLEQSDDCMLKINKIIAIWFLLKKFTYVQYMMDKNTLHRVHEDNVKKQRQVAKEKCDAIGFVSYSELWKLARKYR